MSQLEFDFTGSCVLVVDDAPVNLHLLMDMLENYGMTVRTAESGRAALDDVAQHPPDVVLLDVNMPSMDGYQVAQHLKADETTRDIPIIFISALGETENIVRGFEVGGVDYITKPFQSREVLARVQSQLTLVRQRRQIENLRESDRAQYETINRMKDHFIGAATHDLKNPLATIRGFANMLEMHEPIANDAEAQDWLNDIKNGVNKSLNLVTDMLDILQLDTFMAISPAEDALNAFVAACVQDFQMLAGQKDITLEAQLLPEEQPVIMDRQRMEQVLNNLISNAIKYTPEGGHVIVAAFAEADRWGFQVADNGLGIPDSARERLFDAFYRVKDKRHRQQEGSGLGLAIVKMIVELHQGAIDLESAVNEGSVFTVTIPR